MLLTITAHYWLFAFLTSLGMLQLAGARSGHRYLLLFGERRASAVLGIVLTLAGYLLFFSQGRYGLADVVGLQLITEFAPPSNPRYAYPLVRLEGAQLFLWFGVSAFASLLVCAATSVVRAGHLTYAHRALRRRLIACISELRPLFSVQRRYPMEDETA